MEGVFFEEKCCLIEVLEILVQPGFLVCCDAACCLRHVLNIPGVLQPEKCCSSAFQHSTAGELIINLYLRKVNMKIAGVYDVSHVSCRTTCSILCRVGI